MTTTTNPYVTEDEEDAAAAISQLLYSVVQITEGLGPIVLECAERLRALDRKVEPRRTPTLTLDSDFHTDFAGTQYGEAHQRLGRIVNALDHVTTDVGRVLLGEFDDTDA